ncbi:MAG: rhomboid family intramembrane serine protease [Chloroflexi bacterium]|nr:rhomboid family intramembrane serine protease [Chloroflexota bacterium]
MFPINAIRRMQSTPYVTYLLLLVNTLVFIWELTLPPQALYRAFYTLSVVPCEVGMIPITELAQDGLRSMFLHGGWLHLGGNMAFLIIFGGHVEEYYGSKRFLLFYLAAGLGSAALHALFNAGQCVPVVGASGAIFGVMAAFMLLYPGTRIRMLTLFRGIPLGFMKLPALTLVGYYFVVNVLDGIAALNGAETALSGVAVWGHVGGFLTGLLLTFVATAFKAPPKVDPLAHLDD